MTSVFITPQQKKNMAKITVNTHKYTHTEFIIKQFYIFL